jgi:hypothetical protein
LCDNTTGSFTTAVGTSALASNVGGLGNVALGSAALTSSTTADNNTALGASASAFNTTGSDNVAVGTRALFANTVGLQNVSVGAASSCFTTTGSRNTAVGHEALRNNDDGGFNTAIGRRAGCSNTTGSNNTFVGNCVLGSSNTVCDEVNIGHSGNTARFQGAATAWTFVSDGRDKTDVADLPVGLDFIRALKPRKFKWDRRGSELNKGEDAAGFIAQEVLEIVEQFEATYTKVVNIDDPNQYRVALSNFVPILVNAIHELDTRVTSLEN